MFTDDCNLLLKLVMDVSHTFQCWYLYVSYQSSCSKVKILLVPWIQTDEPRDSFVTSAVMMEFSIFCHGNQSLTVVWSNNPAWGICQACFYMGISKSSKL